MPQEPSSLSADVRHELGQLLGGKARFDEPLGRHCSMGTGGSADALCLVDNLETLRRLLSLLAGRHVHWLIIGRGTNLLPADLGFRGVAVKLEGEFNQVVVEQSRIVAGAAVALASLVERAMSRDLGGLEFSTGIPGCVGGSLPGNAGTASESLGEWVESVDMLVPDGRLRTLRGSDLAFAYRSSNLRAYGGVVTSASFRLTPRPRAQVAANVKRYTEKRKGQPLTFPNVGCIFKNPPGHSAGQLIEQAGLKGLRIDQMEVSAKHANFMINLGGATTAQITSLISHVRERVLASAGIRLETEVNVLDEFGAIGIAVSTEEGRPAHA